MMGHRRRHSFLKTIALLGTSVCVLSSCEKTREQFDFSKRPPDEFAVVREAPLEMPKDYSLRPPQLGAPRPQDVSTDERARRVVLGSGSASPASSTVGEAVFLQKMGGGMTDPLIRSKVDTESAELAEKEMAGVDKLKRMMGKTVEAPSVVVDSAAEAARLKTLKAQGQPVTVGETPTKDQ